MGFPQPAGTVAVNFSIDDTANKVFDDGELEWKGSFLVDNATRIMTKSGWDGPFPKLFDDGPWDKGGHEPKNAVARDNKWGITVFIRPPMMGNEQFEYGLQDSTTQGWIWRGMNGTFTVNAGATGEVNAPGQTMLPFGTNDVKLVIDKTMLLARPMLSDGGTATWDSSKVTVKGSGWSWSEVELKDDGANGDDTAQDNKYTFVLSSIVGAGKKFPNSGLASKGAKYEFVFVFGGTEYKTGDGTAAKEGVTAFVKAAGGNWTAAPIDILMNKNTSLEIP
jgi:hypothetical protein